MKPLCIDLFCGMFGWSRGWLELGGHVVGFDLHHEDYHGPVPKNADLVLQDVLTLHGRQLKDAALIVASPPCTEFSYLAMPWSRGKQIAMALRGQDVFPKGYTGSRTVTQMTALFDACFRIQREACFAAGRHIPLIVENVRGAIPWVGRSRWNFGSYHLWGDVPALMPITNRVRKNSGGSWFFGAAATGGNPARGITVGENGTKLPGNNSPRMWSDREVQRLCDAPFADHIKDGDRCIDMTTGKWTTGWNVQNVRNLKADDSVSKSNARKAASARIAKIPLPLSQWIAKCYYPIAR